MQDRGWGREGAGRGGGTGGAGLLQTSGARSAQAAVQMQCWSVVGSVALFEYMAKYTCSAISSGD